MTQPSSPYRPRLLRQLRAASPTLHPFADDDVSRWADLWGSLTPEALIAEVLVDHPSLIEGAFHLDPNTLLNDPDTFLDHLIDAIRDRYHDDLVADYSDFDLPWKQRVAQAAPALTEHLGFTAEVLQSLIANTPRTHLVRLPPPSIPYTPYRHGKEQA